MLNGSWKGVAFGLFPCDGHRAARPSPAVYPGFYSHAALRARVAKFYRDLGEAGSAAAEWRGMRRLMRREYRRGTLWTRRVTPESRRSAPDLSTLNRSIPPMRNSEYRANQEWKATPKWTERPVRKPGIQLSTVLKVGFWIILATAVLMEVL